MSKIEKINYANKIIFKNGDFLILKMDVDVLKKLIEDQELNKDNFFKKLESFNVKEHFKYVNFHNEKGTYLSQGGGNWVSENSYLEFSNDEKDFEKFGYVSIQDFPNEIKANDLVNVFFHYNNGKKVVYKVKNVGKYNPIIQDYDEYQKYCKFKYDTWGT